MIFFFMMKKYIYKYQTAVTLQVILRVIYFSCTKSIIEIDILKGPEKQI